MLRRSCAHARALERAERAAADQDRALGRVELLDQQADERRLARAGLADQEHPLALVDPQRDVAQAHHAPVVDLRHALEHDHRRARRAPSPAGRARPPPRAARGAPRVRACEWRRCRWRRRRARARCRLASAWLCAADTVTCASAAPAATGGVSEYDARHDVPCPARLGSRQDSTRHRADPRKRLADGAAATSASPVSAASPSVPAAAPSR